MAESRPLARSSAVKMGTAISGGTPEPIEGLPIFRSINLNGEPEAPSIGQSAVENFGEHALCVRADADDMRLAAENSHGECFSRANAIGASEQNNGTAEPWSGAEHGQ